MNLLAHAALLIAAVAHPQHHDKPRHHLGPAQTVDATSYSPCSSSGSHTADGTPVYGRHHLRSWGAVAVPRPGYAHHLRLGTLIRLRRPIYGRSYFRAHDYIGSGSQLDFFDRDCGRALRFGRRQLSYSVAR